MKLTDIRPNESNPRTITDGKLEKLKQSIKSFEKMMSLRPIVVNADGLILGGNMRYHALIHLGYKEIPDDWVKRADDLTEQEQKEFIIKDNIGFGEWNWDELANSWDMDDLIDWGLDIPQVGDNSKSDEPKETTDISFTLTEEQHRCVRDALAKMKGTDEFKYGETFGNDDLDGNALYFIAHKFISNE